MRTIAVLGATGSIGSSTLDLVRCSAGDWRVTVLTANHDVAGLAALAREFRPDVAVIADAGRYDALAAALAGTDIAVAAGEDALVQAAGQGADMTIAAIVGCAGLRPTMAALRAGGIIALANKEALVSAGRLMLDAARRSGATIIPIDSEHNAIFQCLAGNDIDDVRKVTLTASGGPFRGLSLDAMRTVTPEQAIAHPNWSMGAKISVDSATMMNKGLEYIEAFHLFPVGVERLAIVIHPQSVIHSLVEYRDRSTLAQLGAPDMRIPIANALAWPGRMDTPCAPLDLAMIGQLDFYQPDEARFPATRLARAAIVEGGVRPAQLNAANEVAVAAFLARRIGFLDIVDCVEQTLQQVPACDAPEIDALLAVDAEARRAAEAIVEGMR